MSSVYQASSSATLSPSVPHEPVKVRLDWLSTLTSQGWFHYLTLFLLQLKVVWDMWRYRDLTAGDTANYYQSAYDWFEDKTVNILWSPLYTAFYGSFLHLTTNPLYASILHRLFIVFLLTMMVLAFMRRLLPHNIAWLIAAWWAVSPTNFNVLNEIHLFAVIPVLMSWLLVSRDSSQWERGASLAILLASTILVRNELSVAVTLLAAFFLWWEIHLARQVNARPVSAGRYLRIYGVPLLIAVLASGLVFSRSTVPIDMLSRHAAGKHTLNMCQVYAYGYQQRHPEWNKDPWTECPDLMEQDFGEKKWLSLREMIKRNPSAVLENVLWNYRLARSGIQVLLFNTSSGGSSPDYQDVRIKPVRTSVLSGIVLFIVVVGGIVLYRERRYWWGYWLESRALGWLAMLAVASVVPLIIATQRPRPAYLFTFEIFLMALTGMCLFVIIRHFPFLGRWSPAMPILMVGLIIATPNFYHSQTAYATKALSRFDYYERLVPFTRELTQGNTVLLMSHFSNETQAYLADGSPPGAKFMRYDEVFRDALTDLSLDVILAQRNINYFYRDKHFNTYVQKHPRFQSFLDAPESYGWKISALEETQDDQWALYKKIITEAPAQRGIAQTGYTGSPSAALQEFAHEITLKTRPNKRYSRNELVNIDVLVKNTSGVTWPATGDHPVALGYRWVDPEGKILLSSGVEALQDDLASGQSRRFKAAIQVPDEDGTYTLRLTMLQHNIAWFEDKGAKSLALPIVVRR